MYNDARSRFFFLSNSSQILNILKECEIFPTRFSSPLDTSMLFEVTPSGGRPVSFFTQRNHFRQWTLQMDRWRVSNNYLFTIETIHCHTINLHYSVTLRIKDDTPLRDRIYVINNFTFHKLILLISRFIRSFKFSNLSFTRIFYILGKFSTSFAIWYHCGAISVTIHCVRLHYTWITLGNSRLKQILLGIRLPINQCYTVGVKYSQNRYLTP